MNVLATSFPEPWSGVSFARGSEGKSTASAANLKLGLQIALPTSVHSFIHYFSGRWANHDHLTSSLKHIIR